MGLVNQDVLSEFSKALSSMGITPSERGLQANFTEAIKSIMETHHISHQDIRGKNGEFEAIDRYAHISGSLSSSGRGNFLEVIGASDPVSEELTRLAAPAVVDKLIKRNEQDQRAISDAYKSDPELEMAPRDRREMTRLLHQEFDLKELKRSYLEKAPQSKEALDLFLTDPKERIRSAAQNMVQKIKSQLPTMSRNLENSLRNASFIIGGKIKGVNLASIERAINQSVAQVRREPAYA